MLSEKDKLAERFEDQEEKLEVRKIRRKVLKLIHVGVPNLWGHFKDGILKPCDEVCGKKRGRRSKGDTWWWNEEVKESF